MERRIEAKKSLGSDGIGTQDLETSRPAPQPLCLNQSNGVAICYIVTLLNKMPFQEIQTN